MQKHDSRNRTGRTGQTVRKGQAKQDRLNRTGRIGKAEQDRQAE
jgi:hypothetical protein